MAAVLRPPFVLDASPAAALGAGATSNVDYTATSPMIIYDAHDVATATVGGSTAQVLHATAAAPTVFNTVTAALALTTTSAVVRAAVITVAERTIGTGDIVRSQFVDGGGGGANGNLYTHLYKIPITGA